jgi:hypothetical protein
MPAATLPLTLVRGADFGPVRILCRDAQGDPVPLAGWKAYAQVRKNPDQTVIIDLDPQIAPDDTAGEITLPAIPHPATHTLPLGGHLWDLILEDPGGIRRPPIVEGSFSITRTITVPEP